MEFSRQEYWSGYPFPSPRDLPDPGIKPGSLELQVDFYRLSHQGHPGTSPNQYSAQWLQHNPPGSVFPILIVPSSIHQRRNAVRNQWVRDLFSYFNDHFTHDHFKQLPFHWRRWQNTTLFEQTTASSSELICLFFFFGIFTLNDNSLITAHNAINQVTISRWTAANALSNRIHLSTLFSVSKKFCEDSIWQKCLIGVFRVSTVLMHVHPTVISTGHVCSLGSAPGSIVRPLIFFWRIPYFKCRTHLAVLAPSWFWK